MTLPRLVDRFRPAGRAWTPRRLDRLVAGDPCAAERLRLVLGVGRGGTTWVARVLGGGDTPCRCLTEPLYKVLPAVRLAGGRDRMAVGCEAPPEALDTLERLYRAFPIAEAPRRLKLRHAVARDDPAAETCLVKEVHALLASGELLRRLGCPAIALVRDPLRVADSVVDLLPGPRAYVYLGDERAAMRRGGFGERRLPDAGRPWARALDAAARLEPAPRAACELALTVAALAAMWRALEREGVVKVFAYERACARPAETFAAMADALDLPWTARHGAALAATQRSGVDAAADADPYSIRRDTAAQAGRELRAITPEIAALARGLIVDAGLADPTVDGDRRAA